MSSSRKSAFAKHKDPKAVLAELIKLPGNQLCADCGAKGPRWASASLGVFVCIKCSGIHRNLGTHLSFVRSVNLDEWKPEQVQRMVVWGNLHGKAYFEHEVPASYPRPNENSSVQELTRWIRDKYEYCKFVPRGTPERDPRRGGTPAVEPNAADAAPPPVRKAAPTRAAEQQPKRLAEPAPKPRSRAQVPAKPKPPPPPPPAPDQPDLLDFSDPEPVPPQPVAQQPAAQQWAAPAQQFLAQPHPPQQQQPPPPQQQMAPPSTHQQQQLQQQQMAPPPTHQQQQLQQQQQQMPPPPQQQMPKMTSDAIMAMYAGGPGLHPSMTPTLSPQRYPMMQPGNGYPMPGAQAFQQPSMLPMPTTQQPMQPFGQMPMQPQQPYMQPYYGMPQQQPPRPF